MRWLTSSLSCILLRAALSLALLLLYVMAAANIILKLFKLYIANIQITFVLRKSSSFSVAQHFFDQ